MKFLVSLGGLLVVLVIGLITAVNINSYFNDKVVTTNSSITHSYIIGYAGHVEFTKFNDNGYEIKTYPGYGHRFGHSKLYQDIDSDGSVDRIRINASEMKAHTLLAILVRKYDYREHQAEFDEADRSLADLIKKFK
jgi:hypothetical protein